MLERTADDCIDDIVEKKWRAHYAKGVGNELCDRRGDCKASAVFQYHVYPG